MATNKKDRVQALVDLVQEHFPDVDPKAKIAIAADGFWSGRHLNVTGMIDKERELDLLNQMRCLAGQLWEIHEQLNPRLVAVLNLDGVSAIEGEFPVRAALRHLLHQLDGVDPWAEHATPPGKALPAFGGGMARAQDAVAALYGLSVQELHNQVAEKTVFMAIARDLWERHSGRTAPVAFSESVNPGNFSAFVSDLIALLGLDWHPKSCFKAWKKYADTFPENFHLRCP